MTQLTAEEFVTELESGEQPFVGLDIAINMKKGLRFVARVDRGIRELTLRFRPEIRLSSTWPFLDLPIPATHDFSRTDAMNLFHLPETDAEVVAMSFRQACIFAVDAPCSLASDNERRASELAWHQMEIPELDGEEFLKQRNRGVLWSPRRADVESAIRCYFLSKSQDKPNTQQLLLLSQALWMFVGLWVYEVLGKLNTPTIEVYPHASRIICQEIAGSERNRDALLTQTQAWSRVFSFDDFITHKSETNDAAIASFTAFLHHSDLTEELAPAEIVIPQRPVSNRVWNSDAPVEPDDRTKPEVAS